MRGLIKTDILFLDDLNDNYTQTEFYKLQDVLIEINNYYRELKRKQILRIFYKMFEERQTISSEKNKDLFYPNVSLNINLQV